MTADGELQRASEDRHPDLFWGPLLDLIAPTPYVNHQSALDSTVPHGWNDYWKSTYLPELRDDLIDVIAEHAFACASPRSYAVIFHLGGAVSRVPEAASRPRRGPGEGRLRWHTGAADFPSISLVKPSTARHLVGHRPFLTDMEELPGGRIQG